VPHLEESFAGETVSVESDGSAGRLGLCAFKGGRLALTEATSPGNLSFLLISSKRLGAHFLGLMVGHLAPPMGVPAFVIGTSCRSAGSSDAGRSLWLWSQSIASPQTASFPATSMSLAFYRSERRVVRAMISVKWTTASHAWASGKSDTPMLATKTCSRQTASGYQLPGGSWDPSLLRPSSSTYRQASGLQGLATRRRCTGHSSHLSRRWSMHEPGPDKETFEWYRYDPRWSRLVGHPAPCLELPPIPAHLVRVRFAPSPTGNLHVGGARTALFNWLYARNQDGNFIIRIEDTDQARSTRASELAVLRDLRWLGLDWDEGPTYPDQPTTAAYLGQRGPYRQSERAHIYEAVAARLIEVGAVYPCFCTEQELERKRREAEALGKPPQYDGTCREASPDHIRGRLKRGDPYALRFRVPADCRVSIRDVVRGDVSWDAGATIGDFIIVRSSGLPVYNFCVAVDDALMGITTVIRAEEHLTNTLRQALILDALDYDRPQYAHVSLILGSDRQKLSKRHGATSIDQFAREGYLPEAMMNYLALLGWNDGTEREIFTPAELIQAFSLNRITKSAAVFDVNKLRWMNGLHLRAMPTEKLCGILTKFWLDANVIRRPAGDAYSGEMLNSELETAPGAPSPQLFFAFSRQATELLCGSVELAKDCVPLLKELLLYPLEETIENGDADELLTPQGGFLDIARAVLESYESGSMPALEDESTAIQTVGFRDLQPQEDDPLMDEWKAWVKAIGKRFGRKGKRLFHPIRLAFTGRMSGPDVGEILRMLTLARGVVQVPCVPLSERMLILKQVVQRLDPERYATLGSATTTTTSGTSTKPST
jgi:glutamyl-tRNA synthetase